MKRFKLTVAYDGTTYCGYQYQPELPTIEGTVNDALSGLLLSIQSFLTVSVYWTV